MADIYIENSNVKAGINFHGAELVSLITKKDSIEHMWSGDDKYWGRVSPVLFPFVGKLDNQTYRHGGRAFDKIPQHGFARDCEFKVVEKTEATVWLELEKSELMQEKYPFEYVFKIGYKLENNDIHVIWQVNNTGKEDLYFSIGAHPAFMCEGMDKGKKYYLDFNKEVNSLESGIINADGVLGERTKQVEFKNNLLELTQDLFSEDALIFDGNEIDEVTIIDENKNKFISVKFDTPQLGIWSPVGKNAPFVCIEPWYGRCDRAGFTGELKDREYGNILKSNESFEKQYTVTAF